HRGRRRDPAHELRVVDLAPGAHAARYEQHVEWRAYETVIGEHPWSLRTRDRTGLGRHHAHAIVVGHETVAEHLERPEDVQQLELGKQQDTERSHDQSL